MTLLRFSTDLEIPAIALEGEASVADHRRVVWLIGRICDAYGDAEANAQAELRHGSRREMRLREARLLAEWLGFSLEIAVGEKNRARAAPRGRRMAV